MSYSQSFNGCYFFCEHGAALDLGGCLVTWRGCCSAARFWLRDVPGRGSLRGRKLYATLTTLGLEIGTDLVLTLKYHKVVSLHSICLGKAGRACARTARVYCSPTE